METDPTSDPNMVEVPAQELAAATIAAQAWLAVAEDEKGGYVYANS